MLVPTPGIIETDLGAELILLDPATQEMFSLNETGRLVWRALPAADADALAAVVVARFEVDPARARADVERLLARLLAAGLVAESR